MPEPMNDNANPTKEETMNKALWYLRLTFAHIRLGWGLRASIRDCWKWYRWDDFSDYRTDGFTPMEAARDSFHYAH